MNRARRSTLGAIRSEIEKLTASRDELLERLRAVADEEQEYLDNMPDAIRDSDKGARAEEAIASLEEACDELENIDFDPILSGIETAAA